MARAAAAARRDAQAGERVSRDTSATRRAEPERWIDEGPVRGAAAAAVSRATSPKSPPEAARRVASASLPDDVVSELVAAAGQRRAAPLAQRLDAARRAFTRERYPEARRLLAPLAREAPRAAAVRELLGLTNYRLERWRPAAVELEAFRALSGSVDQHPVLADCYRALKRYTEVDALWRELGQVSPSAELVAEGRIVAAGALADQGDLGRAIALLEAGDKPVKRAKPHHLRLWYSLADLHDRAGDSPRARSLFARVAAVDPEFADVQQRLAALGR